MEQINRGTGLLIVEVISSNPNGDPDRDSDPRTRYDDRGEISPVSFKRKIRNLVLNQNGPVFKDIAQKVGISKEDYINYGIIEDANRNLKDIQKLSDEEILNRFWDARVFGTTTLGKKAENGSSIRTGVAQFGLGVSLSPVRIERMTNSKAAAVEDGKDKGMAPFAYRVITYGVYAIPFFINATAAENTNCTPRDIDLLLKLIPSAYVESASYVRTQVNIRNAFYVEHNRPRGCYNDFEIIQALTPERIGDNSTPATSYNDYDIEKLNANINALSEKLKGKTFPIRDLIKENYDDVSC